MKTSPFFSVIMPVHNREDRIRNSIDSVLKQTCGDFELIVVDDNSDDSTSDIISEYGLICEENKFKSIRLDSTSSAFTARKKGIEEANGEYIMFIDSDDELELFALEILKNEISREAADIIHFNARVVSENSDSARVEYNQKLLSPYFGRLEGEDVFLGCFCNNLYKFTLWNKVFSASVCKKAMADFKDGVYMKANDLLLFFPVALYAKSYRGIDTAPLYNYNFGVGSTGGNIMLFDKFFAYGYLCDVSEEIINYAEKKGLSGDYYEAALSLKDRLFFDCIDKWFTKVDIHDCGRAFDYVCDKWGIDYVLDAIGRKYGLSVTGEMANRLHSSKIIGINKLDDVKTIGVYYLRMKNGGVQRVLSLLLPVYVSMGYRVVLFTDEYDKDGEYPIPPEVIRVVLPPCVEKGKVYYSERAKIIRETALKYDIKLMLYNAASVAFLAYDFIFCKSLGMNFILTKHEFSTNALMTCSHFFHRRFEVYKIIDVITVLSRTDEAFLNLLGCNATYVPNILEPINPLDKLGNEIVWLGRLERSSKQYDDVVKIISIVKQKIPDIKLLMACSGEDDKLEELKNMIADYGVAGNIEILPFINDVERYYSRARVHLVTSVTESFPMTVAESKAYAIPLVIYDLPYLEMLRSGKGYISVPQRDVFAAADAIVSIFENKEVCDRLSREARESVEEFYSLDYYSMWKNIIEATCNGGVGYAKSEITQEEMGYILNNIVSMYKIGSDYEDSSKAYLKKQLRTSKKRLEKKKRKNDELSKENEELKRKIRWLKIPVIGYIFLAFSAVKRKLTGANT